MLLSFASFLITIYFQFLTMKGYITTLFITPMHSVTLLILWWLQYLFFFLNIWKERREEGYLETLIVGFFFSVIDLINLISFIYMTKKEYIRISFPVAISSFLLLFYLQRNFVESMAGYSLVCYLLQVWFSSSPTPR